MKILLTNDDGYDSPFLRIAIRCARSWGELTVVVPSNEQSWMGKRMTRQGELRKTLVEIEGEEVHCFSGSPADCVNFGIYHLFEEKPDLVVSGINIGKNTGLGYVLSSGTVGACLEANIAGVPGVAFSQEVARDVYRHWSDHREIPEEAGVRLSPRLRKFVSDAYELLSIRADFPIDPVTWNFNFPSRPADNCELKKATIGHTFYGSYFDDLDGVFSHARKFEQPVFDRREEADGLLLELGHASMARIDIRDFGQDTNW
ncbi:MAG: 5'-nucleotidase SurE [Candidatus Moanabacter tarae]|uniref:5'-nucleotidase n=1 Tax=Candidatus Moanibacter tarae TaxID=2200854 RepID=A0A2Z4AQ99_9BACT|nr:MAG: 5'-nucleotidase SurE [Candidatus Moanabacter tarae]|tara:strand:+ start:5364 stop:6140 length:777 start_codon:yes stop_codon:yes gene_type:complete